MKRDYFVRLEGRTRFEAVNAMAPIEAAAKYSGQRGLEEGSVVQVKTRGAKVRQYRVGRHPRSVTIIDVVGAVLT